MTKKNGDPAKTVATTQLHASKFSNKCSAAAQRSRFIEAARAGPVDTFTLSREWDIYDPPARVHELRRKGYAIDTCWQLVTTESGQSHRVGVYVLISEPNSERVAHE